MESLLQAPEGVCPLGRQDATNLVGIGLDLFMGNRRKAAAPKNP